MGGGRKSIAKTGVHYRTKGWTWCCMERLPAFCNYLKKGGSIKPNREQGNGSAPAGTVAVPGCHKVGARGAIWVQHTLLVGNQLKPAGYREISFGKRNETECPQGNMGKKLRDWGEKKCRLANR